MRDNTKASRLATFVRPAAARDLVELCENFVASKAPAFGVYVSLDEAGAQSLWKNGVELRRLN